MFFICLLNDSVTGGAVVGDVKKMLVVIERSWDVGGVFGEHPEDVLCVYFKAWVVLNVPAH